ncbi:MAG: hypothetical protein AB8B56_01970 [Crocinitomicaceae bacterium]
MSTFVKNYYSPKNPAIFLSVSWETGYRDIQVRYNGRLVHTIPQPTVLVDGVKIRDEELGVIKFKFTSDRPRKLVVKVNNKKFNTVNKFYKYEYVGLVTVFTTLALFAGIEAFMLAGIYEFNFAFLPFTMIFVLGLIIAAIYGVTSFFLSKRVAWMYFVGAGIFTVTTVLSVFNVSFVLATWANYFVLFIRLGILAYLLFQMKHIIKEIRKANGRIQDDSLLDSE